MKSSNPLSLLPQELFKSKTKRQLVISVGTLLESRVGGLHPNITLNELPDLDLDKAISKCHVTQYPIHR